ncbi:MAG: hypothetical protein IRY88_14425 [Rubrobacteraceae bacterium]|nr:hypothetical protein [Rubrobacteraceae bacterium]
MTGSPLTETLGLIEPSRYRFGMRLADGTAGLLPAHELIHDRELLARQLEGAMGRWNLNRREAATFMAGSYAWSVGGPAAAAYVLARRAPDVSPQNVLIGMEDGGILQVALARELFAALASDPAAGHPGATTLEDERGLLRWLRERLLEGLGPLIENAAGLARVGTRMPWARAADLVAHSFLVAGEDTAEQPRYAGDAADFINAPSFAAGGGRTDFLFVERGGVRRAFLVRGACCGSFRKGAGYCDGCPALSREERLKRALNSLGSLVSPSRTGVRRDFREG